MVDYYEQHKVARSMIKWGGSFIRSIGDALMHADRINAQKIHDAFPEYWEEYLKKKSDEVNEITKM